MDYTFFPYIPTNYSEYPNINDLPKRFDDVTEAPTFGIPEFMENILLATNIKNLGLIRFYQKFGIRYLSDSTFRKISDNSIFLFLDGYYIGAFKSRNDAFEEGKRLKELSGDDTLLIYITAIHLECSGREGLESELFYYESEETGEPYLEFEYTFFPYIPADYIKYPNINDLPIREDDTYEAPILGIPDFMIDILAATHIKDLGKDIFMKKFGIRYLSDPLFRELSNNSIFLFVDGYYFGVFKTRNEALEEGEYIKNTKNLDGLIFTTAIHSK